MGHHAAQAALLGISAILVDISKGNRSGSSKGQWRIRGDRPSYASLDGERSRPDNRSAQINSFALSFDSVDGHSQCLLCSNHNQKQVVGVQLVLCDLCRKSHSFQSLLWKQDFHSRSCYLNVGVYDNNSSTRPPQVETHVSSQPCCPWQYCHYHDTKLVVVANAKRSYGH
jgi:hypothetical protein